MYAFFRMIVTSDILSSIHSSDRKSEFQLKPGELYLWESTQSGELNDGVPDVFNTSFLGVQVQHSFNFWIVIAEIGPHNLFLVSSAEKFEGRVRFRRQKSSLQNFNLQSKQNVSS